MSFCILSLELYIIVSYLIIGLRAIFTLKHVIIRLFILEQVNLRISIVNGIFS